MRHLFLPAILVWCSLASFAQSAREFRSNQADTFYGKVVYDPYRSLEDTGNIKVKAWMKHEDKKARNFFSSLPGRENIRREIQQAYENKGIEEIGNVKYWKGKLYVTKRKVGQERYLLYEISPDGKEKLLMDPANAHPELHSKNIMLSYFRFFSRQSQLFYMLTVGGNEMDPKFGLHNMTSGKEMFDTTYLQLKTMFGAFDPERADAFYYAYQPTYKKPGVDAMHWFDSATVRYHVLGTKIEEDETVIDYNPSEIAREVDDELQLVVEDNLPYAIVPIKNKVANEYRIYIAPRASLHDKHITWKKITDFNDKVSQYVLYGNYMYMLSNKNAGNSKVLRLDLRDGNMEHAVEIMPHSKKLLIKIDATRDELLITALEGGRGKLYRIAHGSTTVQNIKTPLDGNVDLVWCDPDQHGFIIDIRSYLQPQEYFYYNPSRKKFEHSVIQDKIHKNDVELEVKEVMAKSYDGVNVPLTIIYRKGLPLDGTAPVMMLGYGSYGMQDEPFFWPEGMVWYKHGGIRAIAHVRGGGAFGEEWHIAGQKANKPNTWKDFNACAEYLIRNKYCTNKTLMAAGASAGGITVTRAVTERPDLFAVAMIGVGALDMVRFETSLNGYGNTPEFGTVKDPAGFKALYEMSAYHHISAGVKYPTFFLSHGVNDNRVPVWMTLKMGAIMEEVSSNDVLIKLNYDSGHGAQQNISTMLDDTTDNYTLGLWLAKMPGFTSK